FRFRSAIRGRRCREQLRRIDCQRQRKVLVRPAKEAILKRWHFKARSGVGGLTRRSRISKALRGKAEIISPRIARITPMQTRFTRSFRGRRKPSISTGDNEEKQGLSLAGPKMLF